MVGECHDAAETTAARSRLRPSEARERARKGTSHEGACARRRRDDCRRVTRARRRSCASDQIESTPLSAPRHSFVLLLLLGGCPHHLARSGAPGPVIALRDAGWSECSGDITTRAPDAGSSACSADSTTRAAPTTTGVASRDAGSSSCSADITTRAPDAAPVSDAVLDLDGDGTNDLVFRSSGDLHGNSEFFLYRVDGVCARFVGSVSRRRRAPSAGSRPCAA